jgi:hypothetical protein
LKELITSAPILNIADPNANFDVCTYACREGLSGVLTQNGHVVCYESRKLKEHESNYSTHDLELSSIIHTLKMCRNYLMGKKFELRMDHSGLEYFFEQSTLNARQARWLELINEYDFDIKHIKFKEKVVDALSKRVHEMHATTIRMYKTDLKIRILEAIKSYHLYLQNKERIQQGKLQ